MLQLTIGRVAGSFEDLDLPALLLFAFRFSWRYFPIGNIEIFFGFTLDAEVSGLSR